VRLGGPTRSRGALALASDFDWRPLLGEQDEKAYVGIALIYLGAITSAAAATPPWAVERDAHLGFQFTYPRHLFHLTEGEGKPSFHYFVSRDAEAKFMLGAWNNEAWAKSE
jgi:hypothetical protein